MFVASTRVEGTSPAPPGKERDMTRPNETSIHLPIPRGHALRDVALLAALLAAIAAFLAHSAAI
jgi:hypothetical protein